MPLLKDVIPDLQANRELRDSQAYRFRNQRVTLMKLTTGAPCSSHSELFAPWPGDSGDVEKWYALENGFAVGCGTDSSGSPCYPVVNLSTDG